MLIILGAFLTIPIDLVLLRMLLVQFLIVLLTGMLVGIAMGMRRFARRAATMGFAYREVNAGSQQEGRE